MTEMTHRFRLMQILFASVGDTIPGKDIFNELNGIVDTDLADFQVDDYDVLISLVTNETQESILKKCDDVKKSLEKTTNGRLIYKIKVISL